MDDCGEDANCGDYYCSTHGDATFFEELAQEEIEQMDFEEAASGDRP